jgi:predicted dehydrogenase
MLRAAVLGVGHLGSRHAERLQAASGFDLTAVYDQNSEIARAVAERLGCPAASSRDEALEGAEAVVVATSTPSHREVVEAALRAGRHVLVEKPLTGTVAEAASLAELAEREGLVLHVGHVERFNPAVRDLFGTLPPPLFVESHRLAPLVPRSLDIDVIQDLMIHDIDLALAFIGAEPRDVLASGVAVLTERVDIANARLRFAGGVTANLTASRVSIERTRKFRMFLPGVYVSADCDRRTAEVYRLKENRQEVIEDLLRSGNPLDMLRVLDRRTVGGSGEDALTAEHAAFGKAVRGEPNRGVTGLEALAALRVEEAIRSGAGAA